MSQRGSSSATNISRSGTVLCKHNVPAVIKTSGTEYNPGRKFYGCPYWKQNESENLGKKNCRFFRWVEMVGDEMVGDEMEDRKGSMESLICQLEHSLLIAESKAERRKQEKKRLSQDMIVWMKDRETMLAHGRRLNHDVQIIRIMLTILLVVNASFLLVLWGYRSGM
ncbi:unnamed protein product [Linum trigynum]|uniref:GRF-type domain-containing protein n=1 Tax=Linum trigynum TaxID=586398 RepID=A0AAV2DI31_9ROSI